MEVLKSLDGGILGSYYEKIKNTLINKIDVNKVAQTVISFYRIL